jgi:putative hydrolase of the HAD superfamily
MAIKGVIFDLFHTLTGVESEWSDLPWTSDVLGIDRARWDELLTRHSRWRLTGGERDPYAIVRRLAHAADATIPDARIHDATRTRIRRFRDALTRIPRENLDVLTTMRAAGLRVGLISNADAMEVAAWSDSPLAPLFDAAIFSCEVGCAKPDPAIYEKCLAALDLAARACLYVGDGGSNELTGAKQVGLSTVFVSGVIAELWPDRVPALRAACDHHVTRVPEVLALLGLQRESNEVA